MKSFFSLSLMLIIPFSIMAQQAAPLENQYVCPPCNSHCDKLTFNKAGACPHCGMTLVIKEEIESKEKKYKIIAFYLQDGVEVLDFAGPMEVFAYAGHSVFTVSKTKEPIITQGIMKVIPDYDISDAPQADILAFFGGNAQLPAKDPEVIQWVKAQQGVEYYFSVCTGAFILAESGILEGKTATTFHSALDNLEENFPGTKVVKNARYIDNGNIITTAGISAGIDGALHLVAKLQGFNAARNVAYFMEYDKWIPGEGLNLSEERPYEKYTNVSRLKEYTGTYDFIDNSKVELKINDREKSIIVIHKDRSYPLFYLENDIFKVPQGQEVVFERNENSKVTGFRVMGEGESFFRKLD